VGVRDELSRWPGPLKIECLKYKGSGGCNEGRCHVSSGEYGGNRWTGKARLVWGRVSDQSTKQ
jgi:hypothetical protein